jgi:hypothetical protein
MPDLSRYISIATVLDKSQSSPVWKIIDNSNYPAGVAQTIAGILTITQPDNVTISNTNFGTPNIYWSSGALVPAIFELRLDNSLSFQRGGSGYTIVYTVQAPGYTNTVLQKAFTLIYTPPTMVVTNNFDIFTPDLSVQDATNYAQTNLNFISVTDAWTCSIISVEGTTQNITGAGSTFDLNYLGDYYDSQYDIGLTITPQYQLQGSSNFATIIDQLATSITLYAQIPPTLSTLQADLATLKNQLDAAVCDCLLYYVLLGRYTLASSIYSQLVARGQSGSLAGLDQYIFQLLKIFNNNVNPIYVNTNDQIPAYNWGGGAGTVNWTNILGKPNTITVEWLVTGTNGFPGPGSTTYTDSRMTNIPASQIYVFRNGLPQFSSNPTDGDTYYTKTTSADVLTFSVALSLDEKIIILILPL